MRMDKIRNKHVCLYDRVRLCVFNFYLFIGVYVFSISIQGGEFLLQGGGCLIMTIAFILIGPATFIELKP